MTETQYKWMVLENIATLAAALLGAYFISPWCLLILANINYLKNGNPEK